MGQRILVVSAPSSGGKGEACKTALARHPQLMLSVSVATRGPRPGEQDGREYHFWPGQAKRFRKEAQAGHFLEWQQVYQNDEGYRGTPVTEVPRIWSLGKTPLLDIDVEGAIRVKKMYPREATCIFLKPSPLSKWEEVLRGARKSEGPEGIEDRIRKGPLEIARAERAGNKIFAYTVVNRFDSFFYNEVENCLLEILGTPAPFER